MRRSHFNFALLLGKVMRNTSTDGDYLSLVTVWDCGIDGVEADLSLCLTHGASAAAFPTVHWGAIEINGMKTKKRSGKRKKEKEKKCVFAFQREISSMQCASLYCLSIYSALSLSVVLCHSHSLHINPCCHTQTHTLREKHNYFYCVQ